MGLTDWEILTNYMDSVGTTLKTFTFNKPQDYVKVTNRGSANVTYTIGTQSGTLAAGSTITVSEVVSSFTLQATSGTQSIEVYAKEDNTEKIEDTSNDVMTQLAEKVTHKKQLSNFYQKLMKKSAVKVICQGDSLTYGHDTVSADKRTATSTLTDNGVPHTVTRAGVSYPEKLQQNLIEVYGNSGIMVINKGFSGDWASTSYEHWGNNDNADVALLMLGTNDSKMGSSVAYQTAGDINAYIDWMEKIIKRYIAWGTPVILLTSPRLRTTEDPTTTTSHVTETFRYALQKLADEYDCPLVDTEEFSNGWDNTYYSDTVHFNTKGYSSFADRLSSILIGYGVKNSIYAGKTLSIRPTRDNIVLKGANVYGTADSPAPTETMADTTGGLVMGFATGTSAYYSFYAEQDNLILIPIHTVYSGSKAQYILDFGCEQGSIPLLHATYKTIPHMKPPSDIMSSRHTFDIDLFLNNMDYQNTNDYLHITNKGWHNIRITNPASGAANFYGFVVMSYEDFRKKDIITWNTFTPTLKGATVSGTHTYTLQGGRYRYDKKTKTTYIQVVIDCTVDATIDGNVSISTPLDANSRPLNVSSALNVSDIRGFRADASPIFATLAANTSDIYIQYLATTGNHGYIAGNTIQGKRVSITISGSFIAS